MSGICGWSNNQLNIESSRPTLEIMASELHINPRHIKKNRLIEYGGLATVGLPQNSDIYFNDGLLVAIQGNIRIPKINSIESIEAQSNAQFVHSTYLREGISTLNRLSGSFALCIMDMSNRKTLIAIDKAGIGSLFYAIAKGQLIFGSNARSILKHPNSNNEINQQGIFDYIYFHMLPSPRCIFTGMEKLLPGEYLLFDENKARKNFYWQPSYQECQNTKLAELEHEFMEILESSVRRSVVGTKAGAFLSGGTDSSTISGMFRKINKSSVDTYSIGFHADGFDETTYARIASKYFDTTPHEYYLTPQDVVDAIPLIAKAYDEPFGNASAVPAFYCAKLAQSDGLTTLLAGDGGDELFAGNERYAKQKIFEFYLQIPVGLRRLIIEPTIFNLPYSEKIPLISKAQSYINQANIPLPMRLETYNQLHRVSLADIFESEFLAMVDINEPKNLLRMTYERAQTKSTLNKMLYLDLKFTLADNDLRKVNHMCELAQMEVQYPFLDDEFLRFSSQLPSNLKLHRLKLRYFFKHALRNFLPIEILQKSKKGFGLPFGIWMQNYQPLNEIAHESILSLSRRGIVKPEFINSLIFQFKTHQKYFGVIIWVLMMLEQWIQYNSL